LRESTAAMPSATDTAAPPAASTANGNAGDTTLANPSKGKQVSETLQAKRERQRAQADVQLLMNRLKHLQLEEERARKKIDETNCRAKEISNLKKRNEDKRLEMEAIHNENEGARTGGAASNHKMAQETRRQRKEAENRMRDDKTRAAREMKDNRKANENAIRQGKNAYRGANQAMKSQIKERQAMVKTQRQAEKAAYEARQAAQKAAKLKQERDAKALAEAMIVEMEKQEEMLIEKLRATQDRQRKAYEGLEQALQS